MKLDWGDGRYETTARQLADAATRAVEVAGIAAGERVLDLGCGTGNAALVAARRGARVTAVDPADRLLEVVRERAAHESLAIECAAGDGASIAVEDGRFDAVVAVFSVIFAPQAAEVAAEMVRVVRPGGRIVVTSWVPRGAINDVAELLLTTGDERPVSPWGDPATLRGLFADHDAAVRGVRIIDETLAFEASSPEAWFADAEAHHPAWRALRVARGDSWDALRTDSIDILTRGNEDPRAFRTTSEYLIARVDLRD